MNRQSRPLSKPERRLFWISGGAIAFLAAFAGIWQWLNTTPQINIPAPVIPEPNGYDFYLRAGQAYMPDATGVDENTDVTQRFDHVPRPRSPRQLRQMYPVEEKEVWLRRNEKALKLLHEGLRYPALHPPAQAGEITFPQYTRFRDLARSLAVESRTRAERGDWNGAADNALDGIEFGYGVQRGGPYMAGLVSLSVQAISLRELRSTLPHLDAAAARRAANRMKHLYAGRFPYSKTLQEEKWREQISLSKRLKERNWRLKMPLLPANPASPAQYGKVLLMSKRRFMENYTKVMDAHIANAQLPYTKAQPVPAPDDLATDMLTSIYKRGHWNWARMETSHLLVMTMLALQAFKLEEGRYPADLDELVPKYLKQVPADPFGGGESLRYRLNNQKYTLWSIGPDGIDNQGKPIVNPDKKGDRARHLVIPESRGNVNAEVNYP